MAIADAADQPMFSPTCKGTEQEVQGMKRVRVHTFVGSMYRIPIAFKMYVLGLQTKVKWTRDAFRCMLLLIHPCFPVNSFCFMCSTKCRPRNLYPICISAQATLGHERPGEAHMLQPGLMIQAFL